MLCVSKWRLVCHGYRKLFSIADSPPFLFWFGYQTLPFCYAICYAFIFTLNCTIIHEIWVQSCAHTHNHTHSFTYMHSRLKKLRVDDLLKHTRDQKPDLATEIKRYGGNVLDSCGCMNCLDVVFCHSAVTTTSRLTSPASRKA